MPDRGRSATVLDRMSSAGIAARVAAAWLASRFALMAAVVLVAAVAGIGPERHPLASGTWFLDRFAYWDSYHFLRIADRGYLPPGLPCCDQAFFPGYPALVRAAGPLVGGSAVAAGILVTLVAGAAAAVLLWHVALAEPGGGATTARRAVTLLALAPCGFFLVAVYSEATFLALALGAWLAATRRHWWLAGLLAAAATAVRVNGLFLVAGLAVMYVLQLRSDGRRPRGDVVALALPALPVVAFVTYLHARTGSWTAWHDAEQTGWRRSTAWPWVGAEHAWSAVTSTTNPYLVGSRLGDIATVALAVAVLAVLLRRRRWPEATYLGLSLAVIVCSTLWVSAPRYVLTWFPVWTTLGTVGGGPRGRAAFRAMVTASVCLLALATYAVATRHWVA